MMQIADHIHGSDPVILKGKYQDDMFTSNLETGSAHLQPQFIFCHALYECALVLTINATKRATPLMFEGDEPNFTWRGTKF